jgi:hypothetical protein
MSLARKSGRENPGNTTLMGHIPMGAFFEDWPVGIPAQTGQGSIFPRIAYPPLQDRLIALFNLNESDPHSLCAK